MDKTVIANQIRKTILESLLSESKMYLEPKDVPPAIRSWTGNLKKFILHQTSEPVRIGLPWHESDRVTYQFFKLNGSNATPVGNSLTRSGFEVDSPQGYEEGEKKSGVVNVPEGHVLVELHTYPPMAEIYTGPGAQMMIDSAPSEDLSPAEILALVAAKGLKPAYRPKFKEEVYQRLISLGLMASNKSITVSGKNYLYKPGVNEKFEEAKELYEKQTRRYFSGSIR